ncbi:hypothetical protein ADL35_09745 [Streptomyces sp. NRRL WC-3753]|nr:hypothetical protein ADL35_09745 [Streptomyces sp. NRRL WC-3753]
MRRIMLPCSLWVVWSVPSRDCAEGGSARSRRVLRVWRSRPLSRWRERRRRAPTSLGSVPKRTRASRQISPSGAGHRTPASPSRSSSSLRSPWATGRIRPSRERSAPHRPARSSQPLSPSMRPERSG